MRDQTNQPAIDSFDKKDKAQSRATLIAFLRQNPNNAQGWRLLAQYVDRKQDIIYCLERVVQLDPNDQEVRRALARLGEKGQRSGSLGTQLQYKPILPVQRSLQPEVSAIADQDKGPHPRKNWPLIIGSLLVLFIVFLAIAGPYLAPQDPLKENIIVYSGGKWYVPPFDFLTPGFPFGSDNFGRDLYSRLLWAIRPTMSMVIIVAALRLVIGIVIGLLAGWLNQQTARVFDTMIEIALAIPVFLVAMGAIALVGVELGLWAFVIGLSLTGWVDTAQQVREQTRIVKSHSFIEAAQSLGASSRQVLVHHVLKQITPMIAMLFAFEISSTLMTTAGLGFLGYYIGGDVWLEVDDFVYRRTSGMPELGQMLATSWVTLTKPWAMVIVGTTIFIAVLGFNLLGEGLRLNLNFMVVRRRGWLSRLSEQSNFWLDQHVWHPLSTVFGHKGVRQGLSAVLVLALILSGFFMLSRRSGLISSLTSQGLTISTTNNPASDKVESPATTPDKENASPVVDYQPVVVWEYQASGFSGGPELSPTKDRLYTVSADGKLDCIDLNGNLVWTTDLGLAGIGKPAVNSAGDIFVADEMAGLNRFTPQGDLVWRFESPIGGRSVSGPTIGLNGTLYYTIGLGGRGSVQAVSPEGEGIWVTAADTSSFYEAPIPSPDGQYVFLKEDIFSAETGELLELECVVTVQRYFSGMDNQNYLLSGHDIYLWQQNGSKVELLDQAEWNSSNISEVFTPVQVGVTAEQVAWMVFTSTGGATNLAWVSLEDQLIGESYYRAANGRAITELPDLTAFVCGGLVFTDSYAHCAMLQPGQDKPLGVIDLGENGSVQGGIWLDDKIYVTTAWGKLIAIAEN